MKRTVLAAPLALAVLSANAQQATESPPSAAPKEYVYVESQRPGSPESGYRVDAPYSLGPLGTHEAPRRALRDADRARAAAREHAGEEREGVAQVHSRRAIPGAAGLGGDPAGHARHAVVELPEHAPERDDGLHHRRQRDRVLRADRGAGRPGLGGLRPREPGRQLQFPHQARDGRAPYARELLLRFRQHPHRAPGPGRARGHE